jgi:hypothetical protein
MDLRFPEILPGYSLSCGFLSDFFPNPQIFYSLLSSRLVVWCVVFPHSLSDAEIYSVANRSGPSQAVNPQLRMASDLTEITPDFYSSKVCQLP